MIAGLKKRLAAIPPLIWLLFLVAACLAAFALPPPAGAMLD